LTFVDRGDDTRTVFMGDRSRSRSLARFAAASRTALDAALGALCAVGMSASRACCFAASASATAAFGRFFFFGGIVRRRREAHDEADYSDEGGGESLVVLLRATADDLWFSQPGFSEFC
jgi:hypothetical protein